jgi:hypothetical protein
MASKGITVQKPNAKLAAELNAIGKTMAQDWVKRTGPDAQAILNELQ